MSTEVSDFSTAMQAVFTRMGTAIDGITADITKMNELIAQLQASAGTLTPEDKTLLSDLQGLGEGVATKLEALDAMRAEPVVQPVPPEPITPSGFRR